MRAFPLLFCACLLACSTPQPPAPEPPRTADPRIRQVADIAFTEGPTVYEDGSVFFSEMRSSRTLRYYPDTRRVETFRADSHGTNGMVFDAEWRLISCEADPPRITRTNVETGETEVLAETFEGKRFHRPNDVTFDSKGRLYFTDRPDRDVAPDQVGVHAIYRIDPDGSVHQILAEPDIDKPNGLVISPDDKTFYFLETHPEEGRARMIRAYDLAEDGTVSNMRVFHDFYPGRSGDGMTIDSEGNLWVAAGLNRRRGTSETLDTEPGVYVFAPNGEQIDFYHTWEDTITNVAFGGPEMKTLYVTGGKLLLEIENEVVGTRR